jgi:hypothetical protein
MDAPKGRYRVVEKDGRLIVIDNGTGAPIRSSVPPPPRSRPGGLPAAPVAPAGPGPIDPADALLALAVTKWDAEGGAVIAWEWEQNGHKKRWDAVLDAGRQRRLGRALLAMAAPLPLLALPYVADGGLGTFGLVIALPTILWGFFSVQRLYRETNDPSSSTR